MGFRFCKLYPQSTGMIVVMYRFIFMASLLHCVLTVAASAQETLDPTVVTQLDEVFPDAKQEWKYHSREWYYPFGCLSEKGLVILSKDTVSFHSVDAHGVTLWKRPSPVGMEPAFVRCSRDGRYILLGHYDDLNRRSQYETLTSDGKKLWSMVGPSYRDIRKWIGISSEYIVFVQNVRIREYDWTDIITVVDIESGQNRWNRNIENDAMVEWGLDKLAYVYRDSLSVLALDTGELKWRQSIEQMSGSSDANSSVDRRFRLVPSKDGKRLVVSVIEDFWVDRVVRKRVGGFDHNGLLIWQSVNTVGTPLGITSDNRFLVSIESFKGAEPSENYDHLILTDMSTGNVLWTLPGRFSKSDGNWFVFLKDSLFLCFSPGRFREDLTRGILILNLGSSGQIERQSLLSIHGIQSITRRSEAWLSKNTSAEREVFLVIEGGGDWGSYFIESIGR